MGWWLTLLHLSDTHVFLSLNHFEPDPPRDTTEGGRAPTHWRVPEDAQHLNWNAVRDWVEKTYTERWQRKGMGAPDEYALKTPVVVVDFAGR
jgi:hypothetical protein